MPDECLYNYHPTNAYSYLGGYNLEVSNMLNTITNFADDIYFGGNSLDAYKTFKTGTYDEGYRHSLTILPYFPCR